MSTHNNLWTETYQGQLINVADAFRVGKLHGPQKVTTFSSRIPQEGDVWTHEGGAMVPKRSYETGPAGGLLFSPDMRVDAITESGPNNLNQGWLVYEVEMDGTVHADWRDALTRMDQNYLIISSGGNRTFTVPEIMPGTFVLVNTSSPGTTFTFPNAAAFAAEFGTQLRTGASWVLEISNATDNNITLAGNTGVTMSPTTLLAQENLTLVIHRLGASSWEVFGMRSSSAQASGEVEAASADEITSSPPDTSTNYAWGTLSGASTQTYIKVPKESLSNPGFAEDSDHAILADTATTATTATNATNSTNATNATNAQTVVKTRSSYGFDPNSPPAMLTANGSHTRIQFNASIFAAAALILVVDVENSSYLRGTSSVFLQAGTVDAGNPIGASVFEDPGLATNQFSVTINLMVSNTWPSGTYVDILVVAPTTP